MGGRALPCNILQKTKTHHCSESLILLNAEHLRYSSALAL